MSEWEGEETDRDKTEESKTKKDTNGGTRANQEHHIRGKTKQKDGARLSKSQDEGGKTRHGRENSNKKTKSRHAITITDWTG